MPLQISLVLLGGLRVRRLFAVLLAQALDLLGVPLRVLLLELPAVLVVVEQELPHHVVRGALVEHLVQVLPLLQRPVQEHVTKLELPVRVVPQRNPGGRRILLRVELLVEHRRLLLRHRLVHPGRLLVPEVPVELGVPPVLHTFGVLPRVPLRRRRHHRLRQPRLQLRIPCQVILLRTPEPLRGLLQTSRSSRVGSHTVKRRRTRLVIVRHRPVASHRTTRHRQSRGIHAALTATRGTRVHAETLRHLCGSQTFRAVSLRYSSKSSTELCEPQSPAGITTLSASSAFPTGRYPPISLMFPGHPVF